AYEASGDVYFVVARAPEYGKLSHRDPEELLAGARIEPTERKHRPGDFALWKSSKPGEPSWPSPWGPGRPGWHIECSAMSMKLLGETFDIHGGGLDLVFPHHENEVVQSESFTGRPFARYWMHNGLLTKEGKKISKSDPGTIVLMSDLLAAHDADTIRALLLSSHYRRPTDYGPTRLVELKKALRAFQSAFERYETLTGQSYFAIAPPARQGKFDPGESELLRAVGELRTRFLDAMDDDFNTGGALGALFEMVHDLNRFANPPRVLDEAALGEYRAGMTVLRELSLILGLFREPAIKRSDQSDRLTAPLLELLIEVRAQARKQKNFALGDLIRERLSALGVTLEDRPDATHWRLDDASKS
ncbi:MAG: cysteine--tRNA ligase, partial [Planctomycetota bacterium]|nr:cysteine--tRNA ligase [Planctomycetota bacterium]